MVEIFEDHPRMRGEHENKTVEFFDSFGSSPHARGALSYLPLERNPSRIIPACAGSTTVLKLMIVHLRDHPRMRGEHTLVTRDIHAVVGSSPHARGALS